MKVLVIGARGLRVDYLGCYGNLRVETPAFDTLAATGVVFDSHFADAADTAAVPRAWRTGRFVFPESTPQMGGADLIAILNSGGVATSLVVDGRQPVEEAFADAWQAKLVIAPGSEETSLEATIGAARAALGRLKTRDRWLLWVDLTTPMPPWNLPPDFAEHYFRDEVAEAEDDDEENPVKLEPLTPLPEPPLGPIDCEDDTLFLRIQGSYSAAVTYLDAGLGELLRAVEDDVLIIATSDIGVALGEHGFVGSGPGWPSEPTTHLPLIVRFPGRGRGGCRVPSLTQTMDLAPTLAAFFGLPFPNAQGLDLDPLVRGELEAIRPYGVSWTRAGEQIGWSLRTPEWSLLVPAETGMEALQRLHVRPDDSFEVNDVRQHHLELTEALGKTLHEFRQSARQPGELVMPPLPQTDPALSVSP